MIFCVLNYSSILIHDGATPPNVPAITIQTHFTVVNIVVGTVNNFDASGLRSHKDNVGWTGPFWSGKFGSCFSHIHIELTGVRCKGTKTKREKRRRCLESCPVIRLGTPNSARIRTVARVSQRKRVKHARGVGFVDDS